MRASWECERGDALGAGLAFLVLGPPPAGEAVAARLMPLALPAGMELCQLERECRGEERSDALVVSVSLPFELGLRAHTSRVSTATSPSIRRRRGRTLRRCCRDHLLLPRRPCLLLAASLRGPCTRSGGSHSAARQSAGIEVWISCVLGERAPRKRPRGERERTWREQTRHSNKPSSFLVGEGLAPLAGGAARRPLGCAPCPAA